MVASPPRRASPVARPAEDLNHANRPLAAVTREAGKALPGSERHPAIESPNVPNASEQGRGERRSPTGTQCPEPSASPASRAVHSHTMDRAAMIWTNSFRADYNAANRRLRLDLKGSDRRLATARASHMIGSRTGRLVGLIFTLVFAWAGAPHAQQPTQAQASAIKQSCRSDYQAHCASVPTGGQAALSCLQQHLPDLSPGCQSAVGAVAAKPPPQGAPATGVAPPPPAADRRQEAAMLRRACGSDYRTYCRGTPLGGGAAMACLSDNAPRLSPQCKGALQHMRGG
jgi:hypothetical protein